MKTLTQLSKQRNRLSLLEKLALLKMNRANNKSDFKTYDNLKAKLSLLVLRNKKRFSMISDLENSVSTSYKALDKAFVSDSRESITLEVNSPIGTETKCPICGTTFLVLKGGRPREYCSDNCKNANKFLNALEREILKINFVGYSANSFRGAITKVAVNIKCLPKKKRDENNDSSSI